jgi:hypothetical protein
VHDLIRGDVEVNTKELDDWVMLRPDGVPLYNFACVVDDIGMKITHVVRGEEHFLNGSSSGLLFEALGLECPLYAHIPLILNKDGKKLSKRDADTNMLDYRDKGFPPDAVFNYIALLGWGFSGDRDVFSRAGDGRALPIEDIGKSGSKFDEDKLRWMCGEYVRRCRRAEFVQRARPWLERCAVPPAAFATTHGRPGCRTCSPATRSASSCYVRARRKIGWLFGDRARRSGAEEPRQGSRGPASSGCSRLRRARERCQPAAEFPADRAPRRAVALPSKKDAPDAPVRVRHARGDRGEARAFTEQRSASSSAASCTPCARR